MTDPFAQAVAETLAKPYAPFSPLTGDEVARAVAAIQRELGPWGSDRLHAQWARILATEVWGPNVAAAIIAAGIRAAEIMARDGPPGDISWYGEPEAAALDALRGARRAPAETPDE